MDLAKTPFVRQNERAVIDQLVAALCGDQWPLVEAAVKQVEMERLWRPAVTAITRLGKPHTTISMKIHSLWTERGHRIREQVLDDGMLLDALRILLPTYNGSGLTLYRGENFDRWKRRSFGFAWTPSKDVARMFARGLNAAHGEGGILLCVDALCEAIIAAPSQHSIYLQEYEYVVDPRQLLRIEPIEQFPSIR